MSTSTAGSTMVGGLIFRRSGSSLPGEYADEYALSYMKVFGNLIRFCESLDFCTVLILFLQLPKVGQRHVACLKGGRSQQEFPAGVVMIFTHLVVLVFLNIFQGVDEHI